MHTIQERAVWAPKWTIYKFEDQAAADADKPYEIARFDDNLLLTEGIAVMWDLIIAAGSPTNFNNTNAFIGVGDSATAESAAHTGLQAATNKLYRAMQATFPSRSGSTVTWRAQFAGADANYAWNEFTVANGNSDAAVNMNRRVSAQGTKTSGQVWTVDLAITLS